MTPEFKSHYRPLYGNWAGNPQGREPDYSRCCKEVHNRDGWGFSQCSFKKGHGPDGAYCKIHDPAAVEARQAKSRETYLANTRRHAVGSLSGALRALQAIEAGHNDPRALAKEILDGYRERDWWKEDL